MSQAHNSVYQVTEWYRWQASWCHQHKNGDFFSVCCVQRRSNDGTLRHATHQPGSANTEAVIKSMEDRIKEKEQIPKSCEINNRIKTQNDTPFA